MIETNPTRYYAAADLVICSAPARTRNKEGVNFSRGLPVHTTHDSASAEAVPTWRAGRIKRAWVLQGNSPCVAHSTLLYLPFPRYRPRQRSSTVEHRFCKPRVAGSSPTAGLPEQGGGRHAREGKKQAGRWQSGQLHQTVNLAVSDLRRFKSCSAHSDNWDAGVAQLAEPRLSKPLVAGSTPVSRSFGGFHGRSDC